MPFVLFKQWWVMKKKDEDRYPIFKESILIREKRDQASGKPKIIQEYVDSEINDYLILQVEFL
jgi:hypothetical protein